MGKGYIVRRGGSIGTKAPSINFVSSTFDSITFTITNNDALTVDIFWEVGDTTPDANTLSLAGGATSSNQVASGLDAETSYTIFAFANAAEKAGSQTSSIAQTTPEPPIIYTAATGGTTAEYNDGGKRYKSHTFNSSGTFTVTTAGNTISDGDRNQVDYLIIAGGGGGGFDRGGAGGAGGYRTTNGTSGRNSAARTKVTVTAQAYTITVGLGGAGTPGAGAAQSGFSSSGLSVSTVGGGRGGTDTGGGGTNAGGGNGGSGGGQGNPRGTSIPTGVGTTDEGFDGAVFQSSISNGGGGGGASAAATNQNGGNGLPNTLRTGSSETRGGGGGGGGSTSSTGGTGGGGAGSGPTGNGVSGTANTGGGGGGGAGSLPRSGGNGGSGIVIIRYEIAPSV